LCAGFFLRFRFGDRKEILRDRLEEFGRPFSIDVISCHYILRDHFGPSKHLKKHCLCVICQVPIENARLLRQEQEFLLFHEQSDCFVTILHGFAKLNVGPAFTIVCFVQIRKVAVRTSARTQVNKDRKRPS